MTDTDTPFVDECRGQEVDPYRQLGISGDTEEIFKDLIEARCFRIAKFTTLEIEEEERRRSLRFKAPRVKTEKIKRKPLTKLVKVKLVRERGGMCQMCNSDIFHHIHHLDADPSNNEESNLLLVCIECHNGVHRTRKRLVEK